MTKEFETLLYLFGNSALDRKSSITRIDNPDLIVSMAVKQGIWSCIHPLLGTICDVSKYQLDFLAHISKSVARNEFTYGIIKKAEDAGIKCCLLKGIFVASLYAEPDYRVSSDTDILINPKDEKKMAKFLCDNGYSVEKRARNDHHMKAKHPIGGLLEVHVNLYSKITDKIIFCGKDMYSEPWMKVSVGDKEFYTLGINDNLVYLTAHYIKHFINGGSSIRQMMDLLLYIKKYEDKIDFERYENLIKELKYDKLIQSMKSIGAKYFGFEFAIVDEEYMNLLLEDSEKCGLFGSSSQRQTTVYNQFCERRREVSSFRLKLMMWFESENALFRRLFPNQKALIRMGYSYSKHKALIPLALAHKHFDYVFKKNKIINEKKDASVLNERLQTMKKLSIID